MGQEFVRGSTKEAHEQLRASCCRGLKCPRYQLVTKKLVCQKFLTETSKVSLIQGAWNVLYQTQYRHLPIVFHSIICQGIGLDHQIPQLVRRSALLSLPRAPTMSSSSALLIVSYN